MRKVRRSERTNSNTKVYTGFPLRGLVESRVLSTVVNPLSRETQALNAKFLQVLTTRSFNPKSITSTRMPLIRRTCQLKEHDENKIIFKPSLQPNQTSRSKRTCTSLARSHKGFDLKENSLGNSLKEREELMG